MLYERWRAVVASRPDALALLGPASSQRWTFAALHAAAEAWSGSAARGGWVCPRGHTPAFLLDVLSAWRAGSLVCPLEPGQAPPGVPPPPGCRHLKMTSATTGGPRLVAFTPAQLLADVDHIVATMRLRPEWPNLGVVSMAHSYGFSNLVLPLLLHGIPLILAPAPLPEAVRAAAQAAEAVTLAGVPALWRAWHQAQALPANVRLAISAGAPLPTSLEQQIYDATGLKVHNFYGASECGGIAYDATDVPRTDETCVGAPLGGVTLAVDEAGMLEVRSEAVAETYWPEPLPTLGAGRFRTTDLAVLNDGQVRLCGRASDQINVAGRKLAPTTIEQVLRTHPAVADCLVFGVPDPEITRGEIIVAGVVAATVVSGAVLKAFLLERLPPWQVPRAWWFIEALPANERGKVSRAEWRQRFLASRAQRLDQA